MESGKSLISENSPRNSEELMISGDERSPSPHSAAFTPEEPVPNLKIIPPPKRICHKAYHSVEGYPDIQQSLDVSLPPGDHDKYDHQFLHLCCDEGETKLLEMIRKILTEGLLSYTKVVIFVRRDERLRDLKRGLQAHNFDSFVVKITTPEKQRKKIWSLFGEADGRRCLLSSCSIIPPSWALVNCNFVIWWNIPWTKTHFLNVQNLLTCDSTVLVVLKQKQDWRFLESFREYQLLFPEFASLPQPLDAKGGVPL